MPNKETPNAVTVDEYIEWWDNLWAQVFKEHSDLYRCLHVETELDVVRACNAKWAFPYQFGGVLRAGCKENDLSSNGNCDKCFVNDECKKRNEQSAKDTYNAINNKMRQLLREKNSKDLSEQLWVYNKTGEVYVVKITNGVVTGACAIENDSSQYEEETFFYEFNRDDGAWVEENKDDFSLYEGDMQI